MAHRQTNMARLARQQVREANRVYKEMKANEPRQPMSEVRDWRQLAIQRRAAAFDDLQVGDSLEAFGINAAVAKKNAKSVVTAMGTRWTRRELTGEAR